MLTSDDMEILTLAPRRETETETADQFHGYAVLGRKPVADAARRRELIELVFEGVGASDGRVAYCFNPRHGLSFRRGSERVDLVICFECSQVRVHGLEGGEPPMLLTADSVQPRVDAFFAARGLEPPR